MNKYLIFRTDRIGDFLLSSILIKSIRLNDEKAHISVVSSSKNNSYIKNHKFVDEVFLLNNSFFNKIKMILNLRKHFFKNIIIHDNKKRSKFIALFLKGKKKIYVKKKYDYTHIKIIKDILKDSGFFFKEDSLNFLEEKKVFKNNDDKFILFHYDEKWTSDNYIKKFVDIEPSKNELIRFLNQLSNKTKKKVVVTTGVKTPKIIEQIISSIDINKIKILNNQSFEDLEDVVSKSDVLISCHGAISHIASARKIKQIDIIDKSYEYNKWTSHFRNYDHVYRDKFSVLSEIIIRKF